MERYRFESRRPPGVRAYKKGHGSLCGMPWPFLYAEGVQRRTCGMPRSAPAAPALAGREEKKKACAPSGGKQRPGPLCAGFVKT